MNAQTNVVIIGGGLAGLTAAYQLHKKGIPVTVLEVAERPGGVIASILTDGFELDLGPNSVVMTPALEEWAKELSLPILEAASVSRNRYLVRDKTLHALSPHPIKLLKTPYLSWAAKGRVFTERFRQRGNAGEQSVGAFFRRRFGQEITEALADPIFSGIYAGDIEKLSLDQVLPMLPRWEQEFGSVTKGLMRQKGAMSSGRKIANFQGGMDRLTQALAAPLGGAVRTNARVTDILENEAGFSIAYIQDGESRLLESDRLVYAGPLHACSGIPWFGELAETCKQVEYVPVRTLHVAVRSDELSMPSGFGFLVPQREHLSFLGCIFTSCVFPSKAPGGYTLLTLMMGGAHRGEMILNNPDSQDAAALSDLRDILLIRGDMRVLQAHTWVRALPQKNLGYGRILESLGAFERTHPGFRFAGNAVSGVSLSDTMEYATAVANSIA
jgi:protoporphyrinogen/coproporphyrinogen III oxidase